MAISSPGRRRPLVSINCKIDHECTTPSFPFHARPDGAEAYRHHRSCGLRGVPGESRRRSSKARGQVIHTSFPLVLALFRRAEKQLLSLFGLVRAQVDFYSRPIIGNLCTKPPFYRAVHVHLHGVEDIEGATLANREEELSEEIVGITGVDDAPFFS